MRELLPPNSSILDIPCGYGRFTHPLKSMGFTVTAADISVAMIERTVGKSGVRGVGLDARYLPFKDRSFDASFSMRLFQHLDFDIFEESLKELARVSKKYVIFSFYRTNPLHTMERKIFGIRSGIRFFGVASVKRSIESAGLRVIQLKPILGPIHAQTIAVCEKI